MEQTTRKVSTHSEEQATSSNRAEATADSAQKAVLQVNSYDRIDGRSAYHSATKRLTLGTPALAENKHMPIAAQIWKEDSEGKLVIDKEVPIHQVFDLMIFLGRTLLYFKEAYREPLLYNPENPTIERIGLQGDAMPVSICTENPNINADIQAFSLALNDLGEITGERLRVLARILEELEYY